MAEREKQKMSSKICWKKQHFFRYIKNRKVINEKLHVEKKKKKTIKES